MTSRQIIGKIHLWLGIPTGLLVFIIAITGCLYAFQEEIQQMAQPYREVVAENKPFLPPSQLQVIAQKELPGKQLHSIKYLEKSKAAEAVFYRLDEHYYYSVFINPYSGQVLKVRDNESGFFHFVLDGHFYLWLPPAIGQPVVATSTLIFVIILISGLILWFPRNKNQLRRNVIITWKNGMHWKKKIFDLHNILGFYICLLALVLALTGLVWGFQWFAKGWYKTVGGQKSLMYEDPGSTKKGNEPAIIISPIDSIWFIMQKGYPAAKSIEVHPPEDDKSSIAANANANAGTYWETDYRYFDQYTLAEVKADHIYGRLKDAGFADKLLRMNYDIHVGAIGGLPGKIIVFLIGLIVASLPVTGFLIWWKIRK